MNKLTECPWSIQNILSDVLFFTAKLNVISWSHIPRNSNQLAHFFATHARTNRLSFTWIAQVLMICAPSHFCSRLIYVTLKNKTKSFCSLVTYCLSKLIESTDIEKIKFCINLSVFPTYKNSNIADILWRLYHPFYTMYKKTRQHYTSQLSIHRKLIYHSDIMKNLFIWNINYGHDIGPNSATQNQQVNLMIKSNKD